MPVDVDVEQLRSELETCALADDHDGVRRAYRELLRAGWARQEIMKELIRLATANSPHLVPEEPDRRALERPTQVFSALLRPQHSAVASTRIEASTGSDQSMALDSPENGSRSEGTPEPGVAVVPRAIEAGRQSGWALRSPLLMMPVLAATIIGLYPQAIGNQNLLTGLLIPAPAEQMTGEPRAASTHASAEADIPSALQADALALDSSREPDSTDNSKVQPIEAGPTTLGVAAQVAAITQVLPPAATPPSATVGEIAAPALTNSSLVERGDALFGAGDVFSARLYYERAAEAGDAQAALRLGETHDPAFLARIRFVGALGNGATAAFWYKRAQELGAPEAAILLEALSGDSTSVGPQRARILTPALTAGAAGANRGAARRSRYAPYQ